MNLDQKFQQRWEYRKKDDDVNSSSDDSKSNSCYEPGQMKHSVLSDLVLPPEDEDCDDPRSQHSDQHNITTGIPLQTLEAKKTYPGSGRKRGAVVDGSKGNPRKKRKRKEKDTEEPTLLADLKTFTESLLKEFKVARNTMLLRMKKQITKLITAKPAPRTRRKEVKNDKAIHQSENGSGTSTQDCKGRPRKSRTPLGSSKRLKATEKRTNHKQATVANEMEKRENQSLPKEKPTDESGQIVSSSCLTLSNMMSKPQTESLRTEFSSSDHNHAGCNINRTNNLERPNFLTNEKIHHGYLPSFLPDEQFGSFSQMSSKNMEFFDQQSNQTPTIHPGLQVPFNQWHNNCFSITSQIVLETPGQEDSSVGLRMNTGGIRFPGRSYAP